ncbi:MAG: hypothetical protein LBH65_00530, partial [Desulfovibrio sp.]|nr:hypothetical protein [Desulfovibrio sp.]
MAALFSRLFKRKAAEAAGGESFAAGFHRFRLFLSAYIEAYGEMMDFEERLAAEMPFGMPFLRLCTAKLTVASMQCILQLNALAPGRFKRLDEAFSTLRSNVQASLGKGLTPLHGPRLVPYCEVSGKHSGLISANLTKLEAIRLNYPEFMPRGFIVTGAAWWEYFNNPDMHDEIDRIMIISQDDPGSFAEAGAAIRERMSRSFPLPSSLEEEVRELSAARYPEIAADGHVLLVRCLPVRDEHGALVMPEQLLRTPVAAADILKAIQSSFSTAYRSRAIIYRLKRGIRDRAMPLCVALTLIPAVHARGSVHRGLDRPELDELLFRVRSSFNTPEHWPSQASVEGASLPEKVRGDLLTSAREALDCLKDAPVRGNRHEVFWAAAEDGRFFVLGVNALPDPAVENMPPPP